MRVYLAGPVNRAPDGGKNWRKAVKEHWPDKAEWADPLDYIDEDEVTDEEIVWSDKAILDTCDAVLVGLTRYRSIGTWREVEYAVSIVDIPVAVWVEPAGTSKPLASRDFSPWLTEPGLVSESFSDCLSYLQEEVEDD